LGSPAAGVLRETLEDLTFSDGGTARGEFIFNPSSDAITNWDIRVSGGDTTDFPLHTYNSSNSSITIGEASYLRVDYTDLFFESTSIPPTGIQRRRDIRFLLEIPMPAAGGVNPFVIEDRAIIASLGSEAVTDGDSRFDLAVTGKSLVLLPDRAARQHPEPPQHVAGLDGTARHPLRQDPEGGE
jgi:hypothetical protein